MSIADLERVASISLLTDPTWYEDVFAVELTPIMFLGLWLLTCPYSMIRRFVFLEAAVPHVFKKNDMMKYVDPMDTIKGPVNPLTGNREKVCMFPRVPVQQRLRNLS